MGMRPDALPYKQVEDDLAETVLGGHLEVEKADAHRLWSNRANCGGLDRDHLLIRSRFDHKFEKASLRQHRGRFKRAPAHGNFRYSAIHSHGIGINQIRLKRRGQPCILPAVHRLWTTGRS